MLSKLGLEIGVIGTLLQSLVAVVKAPGTGVHRGEGLAGDGLDQHGGGGGAAPGTANRGIFPRHPVGLTTPSGIRLKVRNRPLIHRLLPPLLHHLHPG